MNVETTDEHMDAHGGGGGSYEFCTKHDMTLRYDVSKSDPLPVRTVKNIKKSSKITSAGSGASMSTLANRWSNQV